MARFSQKLDGIHDLVAIAENNMTGDFLYRGQSRCNDPVPKIFRRTTIEKVNVASIRCGFEAMVGHEFKDYAHAVSSHCPPDESWFEWLALLQHHGAPTRLLDWSRNILVAAYFAVEKDDDSCGQIWILDSGDLTETVREAHGYPENRYGCNCSPGKSFSVIDAARRLAHQAFADLRFRRDKPCSLLETCRYPLVIAPPRVFPRLAAQRSWFTIHPIPEGLPWATCPQEIVRQDQHRLTLEEVRNPDNNAVLISVEIPGERKREMRNALAALGVTRATMFPDLDGLGHSIIPEFQRRFPAGCP